MAFVLKEIENNEREEEEELSATDVVYFVGKKRKEIKSMCSRFRACLMQS